MSVLDMPKTAEPAAAPEKGKSKKMLIVVLVVALLGGGAGYWFLLKPTGSAKPKPPDPGVVVKLDAIQVNLADDHYLKLGLALQASKAAGEEVDGAKALDAAIEVFSGRDKDKLGEREYRERLKKTLEKDLEHLYEDEVIGVYFTDFVTQ